MWNAGLYKLDPVLFGLGARNGKVNVGPNDEKPVEHINQRGGMGDNVIGQGVGFRAGQFVDDPVHTEEFLNFWAAQVQCGGQKNTQREKAEGQEPGGAYQHGEPPSGHEGVVLQWLTYGQISVVGHDSQDGHLAASKGVHDKSLQQAALIWDFVGGGQEIEEEFRVESWGPVKAVDAEAAEEDVHGLVQVFIEEDDCDEGDVDKQNHAVI